MSQSAEAPRVDPISPARFSALFHAIGAPVEWAARYLQVSPEAVRSWMTPTGAPPQGFARYIREIAVWQSDSVEMALNAARTLTQRGQYLTLWLYESEADFLAHALPDELKSPAFWAVNNVCSQVVSQAYREGLRVKVHFLDFTAYSFWLELNSLTDSAPSRLAYLDEEPPGGY